MSNAGTTGSVPPGNRLEYCCLPLKERPETLRRRAERCLWELEALAELIAADLPPARGEARLVQARWAAARALLLEMIDQHEKAPPERQPIGFGGDHLAEQALLSAMVRRHGWRVIRPGVLVRGEGRTNG